MTFLRWYQATSSPFPNVLLCWKSRNGSTVPTRLRLEPHANGNASLIWDFQPAKVIWRLWFMLTVKSVLKENLNMAKISLDLLLWFSDAQCPRALFLRYILRSFFACKIWKWRLPLGPLTLKNMGHVPSPPCASPALHAGTLCSVSFSLPTPSTKFCSSVWHLGMIQGLLLMSVTVNDLKTIA